MKLLRLWLKRREVARLIDTCHTLEDQITSGHYALVRYRARRDRAMRELTLLEPPAKILALNRSPGEAC